MHPRLLRTMADRPAVRGKTELYRLPCAAREACESKVRTILRLWRGITLSLSQTLCRITLGVSGRPAAAARRMHVQLL
jgi:hypothetical protein